MSNSKPTSVQFPREVHTQIKAHLEGTGISISAWLANAALAAMQEEKKAGAYKIHHRAA